MNLNKPQSEMRQVYNCIRDAMLRANQRNDDVIEVIGYHPDSNIGGGQFYYDAIRAKSDHNGGTVLSTTVPWSNTIGDYLNGVGETDPSGTGCWVRINIEYVIPEMFGATGSDPSDDKTCFEKALEIFAVVNVLDSKAFTLPSLVINKNNRTLVIPESSTIIFDSSINGDTVGLNITGSYCKVVGGNITTTLSASFTWIVSVSGFSSTLEAVEVNDPSKSIYVGDGVNIPYNRGCVRVDQPNCIVTKCNIYNAEGAGLWNYRENTKITNNRIHDNITGIVLGYGGSSGFGDDCIVSNNHIYDNNGGATVHMQGADGILSYKETKGHVISGNNIVNNGEHGTYIQSSKNTVTGNSVSANPGSGLKFGGGINSTCTGNVCFDNCSGIVPGTDDADFYFQSPFGNTSITGNSSTGSASYGIRVVWIEAKENPLEESRIVISSNVVTDSALQSIIAGTIGELLICSNICDGSIQLGQSTTNYPTTDNLLCRGNIADKVIIDKTSGARVIGNNLTKITLNTAAFGAVIESNEITSQDTRLPLNSMSEFNYNIVNYTETTPTLSLFEQGGTALGNSKKRFIGNKFNSSGGRFINFTTSGISGDDNMFVDNEFGGGVSQFVYTWGDNHQFIRNREVGDGGNLAFLRGTNCIITENMGAISVEFPGSNTVANNLTRV